MGHVPGLAGEAPEVDLGPDDVLEFRREPHCLADEVELRDPRPGRAQRQLQPVGVGVGLAAGLHQGRDVVGVDEIADRLLIEGAHGTVFAAQPAGLAVGADVGLLVVEQVLAPGAAAMQLAHRSGKVGDDRFQALAEIGAALEVGHLLPGRAGRQEPPLVVEQGDWHGRASRREQ